MGGGGEEVMVRWRTGPSFLLVKARGKKKVGGEREEKERKSQPYGLRFPTELHLRSDGGRTGAAPARRGRPPSVAGDGNGNAELRQRTASPMRAGRGHRAQAAELHRRAAPLLQPR